MCRFHNVGAFILAAALAFSVAHAATDNTGIGRVPDAAEISGWDIDIRYDGIGLPPGRGDVETGEVLFEDKCASCHGDFGQGEGRWPALSGGHDSLVLQGDAGRPEKTVGSYWPYAPILFDYIRRAMPYTAPQSLSADETYALSALILYLNDIVDENFIADAESLPAINMPNRDNFFDDPRPDVKNTACMSNCLNAKELKLLESIKGVTPTQDAPAASSTNLSSSQSSDAKASKSQSKNPENKKGEQVYMRACAVCHASGIAEAPIAGAAGADDWKTRLASSGMDKLTDAALNGKGAMPPQKAAGLSRDDIMDAILHMLELSGVR